MSAVTTHHRSIAGGNPLCSAAIYVSAPILTDSGTNCNSICKGFEKKAPTPLSFEQRGGSFILPIWNGNLMTLAGRQDVFWWRRVDSNHRSEAQQIYSLPPLATRELLHMKLGPTKAPSALAESGRKWASSENGAGGRIRTPDLLITNQLLYQLSYTSASDVHARPQRRSF